MLSVVIDGETWKLDVSEKAQQILRDQVIDESQPGTILRDFGALLEYIGEDGLKTTSKYYFLPQSKLAELNERMSHPVPHQLRRPQQRSFPHLHSLFLVLRASGMGIGVGTPPNGRLMLNRELLACWQSLNASERYFSLLESWLLQATPEIIAEGRGDLCDFYRLLTQMLHWLPRGRTTLAENRHDEFIVRDTERLATMMLMELFGWGATGIRRAQGGRGDSDQLPLSGFGSATPC